MSSVAPPSVLSGVQFFEFQVTWWNIALLVLLVTAPAYLITLYSRSKRSPTKTRIIKIAYDDGLLIERRLRPLYFRLSKKMIQSVSWLTKTAQSTLLRNKRSRGDGLRSIFSKAQSGSASDLLQGLSESDLAELRAPGLDEEQRVVLTALNESGIFEGSDVTLLTDICMAAEKVKLNKGDFVFESSSKASEFLYVLKTGSCEALFKGDSHSDDMQSVCDVKGKCIAASHVDVIAWITGAPITRQLSLRCTSNCVVFRIPSPLKEETKLRVHGAAYARIVRMLLNKINRATVGTALFHLGLAECMLPNHRIVEVSEGVLNLCSKAKTAAELTAALGADKSKASLHQLLRASVVDVIGAEVDIDPNIPIVEVDVPEAATSSTVPLSDQAQQAFTPPRNTSSSSSQARHGEMLSADSKIAPPRALRGDSALAMSSIDTDDLLAPINLKRSQSFDSTFSGGTGPQNKFSSPQSDFRELTRNRGSAKRLHVQVLGLKKGQNILDIDEVAGLYIVLSGAVRISFSGKYGDHVLGLWHRDNKVSLATPGSIIGHVTLISGTSEEWYGRRDSNASVLMTAVGHADTTWLLHIPTNGGQLIDVMSSASAIFHVANDFIASLPPVLRLFDFCTKWRKVDGGDIVVTKGQQSMGEVLVVLSGRLGVLATKNEAKKTNAWSTPGPKVTGSFASRIKVEEQDSSPEYDYIMGKGAFIGEVELLTGECCKHTVRALRHTSLASAPFSLINYLSQWYPSILVHIARNVSGKQKDAASSNQAGADSGAARRSQAIMVVPISGSVPFDLVCSTLKFCLGTYVNRASFLTSSDAADAFGSSFHNMSENEVLLTVGSWLHEIEFESDIVIYQADWHSSAWNTLIASLCDEVVLVANALDEDPEISAIENSLHSQIKFAPKTLVMLHINPAADAEPSGTRNWIEKRSGVHRHVHVRMNTRNPSFDRMHLRSDFHRLARILTNNAIGLVLGGGGARGICHIGIIQALEDKGIPIDMVGGTSIGAFVGGLYAIDQSFIKIVPKMRIWAMKLSSIWFHIQDLTLPITSYFNGYNFSAAIRQVFNRRKIEDFWINYYCITTDLTTNSELIHLNGTASRYIRASMSLANIFPPVCDTDQKDGMLHYLVDGGYVNTVPVDVMKKKLNCKVIVAVDVSSDWTIEADYNYGDILSGLTVLLSQWNPWAKTKTVPSMADIGTQIAFISACRQMEQARSIADLFISPPVQHFTVKDFGKFDEIRQLGTEYGREVVDAWFEDFMKSEKGQSLSWLKKRSKV